MSHLLLSQLDLDRPLVAGGYGRTSDKDKQDPSLSIPRQWRITSGVAEENGWQQSLFFYDIESGRKDMAQRGTGADGELHGIEVPRAGGLPELLEAARAGKIDAVIVESIDRLSRDIADSTGIEKELAKLDIPIIAADEPIAFNPTAILTRRVKQAIGEFYVADLMVKSRNGSIESVKQGWHAGGPIPYGYVGESHPHPNPNKAADGQTKTKLVPCPVCGPVVTLIYRWYCEDGLGLGEIVDRLNSDLERYPPPKRNKKDENSLKPCWAKASSYTGTRLRRVITRGWRRRSVT